jgi:hypothetical protein
MDETTLRALVDLRDRTIQKNRIAFSNRISAIERGTDTSDSDVIEKWLSRFQGLEDELDKDISKMVKGNELIERMTEIKGVGDILAAKVISMIDIREASTVSSLWRYSGYAVIGGAREKPTKGEKLHYNSRLKTTCYLIGQSFLRCNSPYRSVYDAAREYYEANRPDWTKGHQHNAALRKMIKVWLSHLWLVWRQMEGLETRPLYVHERLNHEHEYLPSEFGWSAVATD